MGVLSSMYLANSGLNAMGTDMSVIGNNITNLNTVGFKQGRAVFANIYGQTLTGKSNIVSVSQPGTGVYVEGIQQELNQGTIQSTTNGLDLAIQGNGFLTLRAKSGKLVYSRNGQLALDKEGRIVDIEGRKLQGYQSVNGQLQPVLSDIAVPQTTVPPKATQNVNSRINLDAAMTENLKAGKMFEKSTNIFDSLGIQHLLTYKFVPTNVTGQWAFQATMDGATLTQGAGSISYIPVGRKSAKTLKGMVGLIQFDGNGDVQSVNYGGSPLKKDSGGVTHAVYKTTLADKAKTPVSFDIAIPLVGQSVRTSHVIGVTQQVLQLTQYNAPSSTIEETQDGHKSGDLNNLAIGRDGKVVGSFTNGVQEVLAAVALANFNNAGGLSSVGGNAMQASIASGPPVYGLPGEGGRGSLLANSLELSTTDLGRQMVDMITAERGYQASASIISTDNAILNTLLQRVG
jgi:flagellar hook protein FlgE